MLGQFLAQFNGVVVGVEIALGERGLHRLDRFRRGSERVLIRSHLDAVHVTLLSRLAQRLSRRVPAQVPYVFGHQLAEVTHLLDI